MIKIGHVVSCLLLSFFSLLPVHVVRGPAASIDDTEIDGSEDFTFFHDIKIAACTKNGTTVFMSLDSPGVNSFTASTIINRNFVPYTSEKIYLNGNEEDNPLLERTIKDFSFVENRGVKPLVLLDDGSLLLFMRGANAYKLSVVADSLGFLTNNAYAVVGVSESERGYVAVAPHKRSWGSLGSGISMVGTQPGKRKNEEGEEVVYTQFSALRQAVPLHYHSSSVKINNAVKSFGDNVTLRWSEAHKRLIVGLSEVCTGSCDNDGARSVVLGYHDKNSAGLLRMRSIFHDDIDLEGLSYNHIIATRGKPGDMVSVHGCDVMLSSTQRTYLVVRGGNGSLKDTCNNVYALPLVPHGNNCGLLAHKDDHFAVAKRADTLCTSDDVCTRVGGGRLPYGTITHMFVKNDAVFVSVADAGDCNGVYHSQAIFTAKGDIKGWTDWQRSYATKDNVNFVGLNVENGSFLYCASDSNNKCTTVKETRWGKGDEHVSAPLVTLVSNLFVPERGGVIDVNAYSRSDLDESTLLVTGSREMICVDEYALLSGELIYNHFSRDNFSSVAPLTCSLMTHNLRGERYLFVAGYNGLSVKKDDDDFVKIGDYHDVRQLVRNGSHLYVVTTKVVDRICLESDNLVDSSVTVASLNDFKDLTHYSGFIKLIVSGPVALLGTTNGLFFVQEGSSITDDTVLWRRCELPEAIGGVVDMHPVSVSGNAEDIACGIGGNVYVLISSCSRNLAFLYRLEVKGTVDNVVPHDAVRVFDDVYNDIYVNNEPAPFMSFGRCKNYVVTDGATMWVGNNQRGSIKASLCAASGYYFPLRGRRNTGRRLRKVIEKDGIVRISRIFKSTVTGSWFVPGNFGMYVSE